MYTDFWFVLSKFGIHILTLSIWNVWASTYIVSSSSSSPNGFDGGSTLFILSSNALILCIVTCNNHDLCKYRTAGICASVKCNTRIRINLITENLSYTTRIIWLTIYLCFFHFPHLCPFFKTLHCFTWGRFWNVHCGCPEKYKLSQY